MSTGAPWPARARSVALFGASLDPPTGEGGHAGIVRFLAARFAQVWVAPVFVHPFHATSKRVATPFEQRVAMARLACEGVAPNVTVSEAERECAEARVKAGLAPDFGTMDLLDFLRARHEAEGLEFTLVLGSDTLRDLLAGKWRRSAELLATTPVLAIARAGVELAVPEAELSPEGRVLRAGVRSLEVVRVPGLEDVSSTRARATRDAEELRRMCGDAVAEYVVAHRMYAFGAL